MNYRAIYNLKEIEATFENMESIFATYLKSSLSDVATIEKISQVKQLIYDYFYFDMEVTNVPNEII